MLLILTLHKTALEFAEFLQKPATAVPIKHLQPTHDKYHTSLRDIVAITKYYNSQHLTLLYHSCEISIHSYAYLLIQHSHSFEDNRNLHEIHL